MGDGVLQGRRPGSAFGVLLPCGYCTRRIGCRRATSPLCEDPHRVLPDSGLDPRLGALVPFLVPTSSWGTASRVHPILCTVLILCTLLSPLPPVDLERPPFCTVTEDAGLLPCGHCTRWASSPHTPGGGQEGGGQEPAPSSLPGQLSSCSQEGLLVMEGGGLAHARSSGSDLCSLTALHGK